MLNTKKGGNELAIEEIYEDEHKYEVTLAEWQPRSALFITADASGAFYIWKD